MKDGRRAKYEGMRFKLSEYILQAFKDKKGVYAVAMRNNIPGTNLYKRMKAADRAIERINSLLELIDCELYYEIRPK